MWGASLPLAGRAVMKDLLPNRLSAWELGDGTMAFVLQRLPRAPSVPSDEHALLPMQTADEPGACCSA